MNNSKKITITILLMSLNVCIYAQVDTLSYTVANTIPQIMGVRQYSIKKEYDIYIQFRKYDSLLEEVRLIPKENNTSKTIEFSISHAIPNKKTNNSSNTFFVKNDSVITYFYIDSIFSFEDVCILKYDFINGKLKKKYRECLPSVYNGEYIEYYPSGNVKIKGEFDNGKKIGFWLYFWGNGNMQAKGKYITNIQRYTKSELYDRNSKEVKENWNSWEIVDSDIKNIQYFKEGEWLYFDSAGQKIKVECYDKEGKIIICP